MAKKTIDELPPDNQQRLPTDVIAIQHTGAGSTFKSTSAPNPVNSVFIETQAQLELTFPNLEIPPGTVVTIFFSASPILFNNPIKLGDGCAVELKGTSVNTRILWNGADNTAFIQMINPTDTASDLRLFDTEFVGTGTPAPDNNFLDVRVDRVFEFVECLAANFVSLGKVFCDQLFSIRESVIQDIFVGLVIDDPGVLNIGGLIFNQSVTNTATPTLISIVQSTLDNPMRILIDRLESINLSGANDRLLYIDSDMNAPGSSAVISNSSVLSDSPSTSDFYQQGTSITITTVSDQTPLARFTTAVTTHGLSVGDIITLSGFTDVEYNQTFTVTAIPTANTFETGVNFVSTTADGVIENQSVPITSVNNLGVAQFVTEVDHQYVTGQIVRITDFTGTGTYNETVQIQVTAVDSFVSSLVFDAGNTGSGKADGTSIDSKDSRILATNNPRSSSSMIQSETEANASLSLTFTTIDTFETLANSVGAADTDFRKDPATERFTVDTTTGILTYNGLEETVALVTYSFGFSKPGGGSQDYEVALFVNGAQITKTTIVLTGQTSTPTLITFNGLITLEPGKSVELRAKDTSNGTTTVQIDDLDVLLTGQ